jgi:hypothetical protein
MRLFLAALAVAVACAAAQAKDITLILTDQDQGNIALFPAAIEQCLLGAALRADVSVCRDVHAFARALAERAKAAPQATPAPDIQPPAQKEPAP